LVSQFKRHDKEPKLITDYLYFLPDDFKEISHIYQRPSGDVLIIVKNLYYLIDFPSFNVKNGYNGKSTENLGIPKGKRIDAIFRTYSGKTYIYFMIKSYTLSLMSVCLDQRKMA
jgi:hypothetical protein